MARKPEGKKARVSDTRRDEERAVGRPSAERVQVVPVGLSVEQAAEALGVSRSYMYQLIAAGAIATARVGRRRLITRATITAYLRARERTEQEARHGN